MLLLSVQHFQGEMGTQNTLQFPLLHGQIQNNDPNSLLLFIPSKMPSRRV